MRKKLLERPNPIDNSIPEKVKPEENKNKIINETIELNKSLSTQQNDVNNVINNEKINTSLDKKENTFINNSIGHKENNQQISQNNNNLINDDSRNKAKILIDDNSIHSKSNFNIKDDDYNTKNINYINQYNINKIDIDNKSRNYDDDVLLNSNLITEGKNK